MVYFNRQRIKEARLQKGKSVSELADMIGRGRATVQGWEKGISNPSASDISNLCNILEIEPGYLFPGVE